jgi:membrane protein required for colicin V production
VAAVGLRPVDRVLGAAFGVVRGVILLLAFTVVFGMTPMVKGPLWQESNGASIATVVLQGLKPVLPQEFGKYLP